MHVGYSGAVRMLPLQLRRLPSATQEQFARSSDISAAGRSICTELSAGLVAVKGRSAPAIDMPPCTGLAPPQAIALPQQERAGWQLCSRSISGSPPIFGARSRPTLPATTLSSMNCLCGPSTHIAPNRAIRRHDSPHTVEREEPYFPVAASSARTSFAFSGSPRAS